MPEPREPRSIIEAAEQSAAAGNYDAAERLLREAATLQEASLGPLHPDLANTLNNLGVVCEINDNAVDAEQCFRRAVAIATAVLKPDHPFVATSRKNLRDFCEARGIRVEAQDAPRESPHPASEDVRPLARSGLIRPLAIGALGPAVMLIMIVRAVHPWPDSTAQVPSPSPSVTDSLREIAAKPHVPLSVAPIALSQETTRTSERRTAEASVRRMTETSTRVPLTLVKARLCANLDDFLCDPPDRPVPPGPLFFYTQVKSPRPTTIQHRWYRDNHLYQSVDLRVHASPLVGYRTFSRHTMTGDSAGSWRVELRTEEGVLLHEEHFSVQ